MIEPVNQGPDTAQSANGRQGPSPLVLHVRVVRGEGGGPDKTILNSPRHLEPRGYRALCAYLHPPGDPGLEHLRARAAECHAPLAEIPDRGPWDVRVAGQLLRLCREHGVAIWHGHDYKSNLLGLLLGRSWPMRLVTTVHGWGVQPTVRTRLYYRLDKLCLPHYERVICVSQDLHRQCLRGGARADRCVLIENGIDVGRYRRRCGRREAKVRLGLPAEEMVLGAVGRLSGEKGFADLLRAFAELVRSGVSVHLLIVGEGPQRPQLERLAAELGCSERVHLLGYRRDAERCYEAMDVFALSSRREGMPNVVLEAMAMEVAVVATRVAGVPRMLRDYENGLLVEPSRPAELKGVLGRLVADEALRSRLAQAGRQTVEAAYRFDVRMGKVAAVYDRLLSGCQPRRVACSRREAE